MKRFLKRRSPAGTIIIMLETLVFIPIIIASFFFSACSHVVDVQTVHDTDTLYRHDTIPGPAFIRFLSILNNSKTSGIVHLRLNSPLNPDLFTDVNPEMRKQFIPLIHDSTVVLYGNYFFGIGTPKNDSLTIPARKPYSMTTVVLFRSNDASDPNRLFPVFADDSLRKFIAPKDSCYVRFINGLPDYPQPSPTVNMHIDNINATPFFKYITTGQPTPVNFQEIRNYVLMPAGQHQIFVRSETDITQTYSTSALFVQGQFYTIRLTGSKAEATDQLSIDSE